VFYITLQCRNAWPLIVLAKTAELDFRRFPAKAELMSREHRTALFEEAMLAILSIVHTTSKCFQCNSRPTTTQSHSFQPQIQFSQWAVHGLLTLDVTRRPRRPKDSTLCYQADSLSRHQIDPPRSSKHKSAYISAAGYLLTFKSMLRSSELGSPESPLPVSSERACIQKTTQNEIVFQ
jgi:hypothetical protein